MTAFGSQPHHDRVLAVVLVVADPQSAWGCRVDHLKPDTPQWEAFWQDIGRPDEGLNGTSEAPATDECVQPACPTADPCPECGCPGCYEPERSPEVKEAIERWRDYFAKPEPASRTHRVETYRPEPTTDVEIRGAVRRAMGDPEPACPTCHGKGQTDEAGGCDGQGKRLTYGPPFTPGTLGPCPGYVKPEPASDPEIEVAMRFVPGLKAHGRRPEPASLTPAEAQSRKIRARRGRLIAASRRLADRADFLEVASPMDHPYPEEAL